MLCSPVISNVQVTKTLIDGGAGLNVLSEDTFDNLQVPYEKLQPTKPFSGVTDGSTTPIGQVRLPVTFGERKNYRTELIALLGKGLLMAHQFCLLMAHHWCAITSTPLVIFTNGAPLVRH